MPKRPSGKVFTIGTLDRLLIHSRIREFISCSERRIYSSLINPFQAAAGAKNLSG